jgi:hypothetical protein
MNYLKNIMMISNRGIWLSTDETDTHEYDACLAAAMVKKFSHLESLVDIGCGNGKYTMNFMANGIHCIGYDGSPLTPELTYGTCRIADFSELVDIGKFDMVLSLEVGEHIPSEYENIFLDNLAYASDGYIVISWAIPGQPGIGHVNCQTNFHVIRALRERGFYHNLSIEDYLRKHSSLPWFKETLMVFKK